VEPTDEAAVTSGTAGQTEEVATATPDPGKTNLQSPMDRDEYIRRLETELSRLRPSEPEPAQQVQTHTALLASGKTVPVFGAVPTHHYDEDLEQTVPVVASFPVRS
jgi:hypothetical protein